MRGCFQECLGCDAKSEYKIAPFSSSELQGIQVSEASIAHRFFRPCPSKAFLFNACFFLFVSSTQGGTPCFLYGCFNPTIQGDVFTPPTFVYP